MFSLGKSVLNALIVISLVSVVFLTGCKSKNTAKSSKNLSTLAKSLPTNYKSISNSLAYVELSPRTLGNAPATSFELIPPSESGIEFQNILHQRHHNKLIETGSGVAIGDYDGDLRPDIYLLSTDGPNRLYRGLGGFKFEDVTQSAGNVDGSVDGKNAWSAGASFADVDNDGDLDLFVCNVASRNLLYLNQGDGTFVESATSTGLDYVGASKVGSFCDYDRDGDLDMYLLTYLDFELREDVKLRYVDGVAQVHPDFVGKYDVMDGHIVSAGHPDILYRNNGDGTFTDVSEQAGISGFGMGLSVTWFDFNGDNLPDIYIGNDFKQPDALYRNNGDGTFTDVLAETVSHTPWFSMGADAGDLNNDGHVDLMIADMSGTTHYKQKVNMGDMADSGWFLTYGSPRQYMRNAVYVNTGVGRFLETAYMSDLESTDWTWSVRFADLNNDGRLDVYITNGHARNSGDSDFLNEFKKKQEELSPEELKEFEANIPPLNEDNLAYVNRGDFVFESVGPQWNLNLNGVSHGAALADFDRDGALDLVVNNLNAPASIYRNLSNEGNAVLLELRGVESNFNGIGAKVEIWHSGTHQTRQLFPVRGYISCDEPLLHFGLQDDSIDRMRVTWPGGKIQEFQNLEVNRLYRIIESGNAASSSSSAGPSDGQSQTLYRDVADSAGLYFEHRELDFNDYGREPLLPYKLSQLGPGVAWGDINGDGYPDVFVGGAKLQAGQLFINREGKKFETVPGPWESDKVSEDMACLFFDADGDDDQDLYVVRGSHEFPEGAKFLSDGLYLNDGAGKFEAAGSGSLPELTDNGSCVCAVDFDRDGDLDLFVGSRSIPGKYPLVPNSRLLRNEGGRFTDVTKELAPELLNVGLVNGALWSDYDGDGWSDLLVALDWGPVTIMRNVQGELQNVTSQTGLAGHRGWWHSLAAGDLDRDGDVDFVATNQGLNTKYHTSPEHPHRIYYDDFDKNGTLDLVEAEYEGNIEYPMRGRSCSSNCMPFIAQKFETFHDFALAEINDIYETKQNSSPHLDVTILESAILWNDGNQQFRVEPLPRLAQISPGFGIEIADLDGDGHLDIFLAQNFFGPQPETGYMDGGVGWMLRGDGQGSFEVVWPQESGIVIPGDATAVALSDYDRDGDLDALVAVNNGLVHLFQNQRQVDPSWLQLELVGPAGNRKALGAQVTVEFSAGSKQLFETRAGVGYLSQSDCATNLPQIRLSDVDSIKVRWPDGSETQATADSLTAEQGKIVIRYDGT